MNSNISFRSLLLGSTQDFAERSALGALVTSKTLAHLIVALSNYKEEGKDLNPEIYLTNNLRKILKFLPGGTCVVVGSAPKAEADKVTALALKQCAPLANSGWAIFVDEGEVSVSYGVFRGAMNPLAIPLEQAILQDGSDEAHVVRIHQSAPSCVDLANHLGDRHTVFLSQRPESEPSPRHFVDDLVDAICGKVRENERDTTKTVMRKAMISGLESSHGALVAVTCGRSIPSFLSDGLTFSSPLDYCQMVRDAKVGAEEGGLSLLAHTTLMQGVFGCDGIIVFNQEARLLGYNCFVRSGVKAKTSTSGGARRRAYAALQQKVVQNKLHATYMRSQDGWSEFKIRN
jgi:hypothetical protein